MAVRIEITGYPVLSQFAPALIVSFTLLMRLPTSAEVSSVRKTFMRVVS
jgi:hypothetical protein